MTKKAEYQIVKAEPGFTLLYHCREEGDTIEHPIVAWYVGRKGKDVHPISPIGKINIFATDYVIEYPSGIVMDCHGEYPDRTTWLSVVGKPNIHLLQKEGNEDSSA